MPRLLPVVILLAALVTLPRSWAGADSTASPAVVDFERPDLDGVPLRLSSFRGKWVVVNFWATWCGPCLREIPMLIELDGERVDLTVIGVNFEEIEPDALRDFVVSMGIDYPVVRAGAAPLLPFEPLKGLPTTFIVSPEGHLVAGRVGEVDREWVELQTVDGSSRAAANR